MKVESAPLPNMFQPMTHDDAGKRVPLVRFNVLLLPLPIGPLPRRVQHAVRTVAWDEGRKPGALMSVQAWLRGGSLGLIPAVVICGGHQLVLHSGLLAAGSRYSLLALVLLLPVTLSLMVVMAPFALTDAVRKACARAAALAGHCGSCGYPLPESPSPSPGPDTHLHRCSECGSDWARVAQVTATA